MTGRGNAAMSLSAKQRRAELLAGSRHGASEELLILGHGFSCRMLAGLVRAGFAAAEREVVKGWRQDDRGRPG